MLLIDFRMMKIITLPVLALVATLAAACNAPASAGSASATAGGQAGTPAATPPMSEGAVIEVKVDGNGFTPSSVHAQLGKKLTLRFTRTSDETCAKQVDFPELGIKRDLPLNQPVDIDVPASSARTLGFQCGMGMFKGSVVIH